MWQRTFREASASTSGCAEQCGAGSAHDYSLGVGEHGRAASKPRCQCTGPEGYEFSRRWTSLHSGSKVLPGQTTRKDEMRKLGSYPIPYSWLSLRAKCREHRARSVLRADGCKAPCLHGHLFPLPAACTLVAPNAERAARSGLLR